MLVPWPSMSEKNLLSGILIGAVLLVSYAYFYQGSGGDWNQNARFDLTRAIVEQHTLHIDAYHRNTGPKSVYGGHYYSDKAPGVSLVAVPALAVMHGWMLLTHLPASRSIRLKAYVSRPQAVAPPTTLAAVCIFLLVLKSGASESGAGFAAVTFGQGTPMFPYATLFRSHATSGLDSSVAAGAHS